MRRSALLLLAAMLGCAAPTPDEQGWDINGVLASDEPSRGHDGPFLAMLFLTDDAEALYDRWNSEPGNFRTQNMHSARPGASVEAVVVFVRCQRDPAGNCNVWGTATVEASDGRILARDVEVPLWVGRAPVPDPALNISEHGIGLVVEASVSSYKFHMVVSDRNAERTVTLVHDLIVSRQP